MVVALEPGKFYGSSLPRPRFYKPNEQRVDPPRSVLDPLMSWAEEAHWSMGGVSFTRHRLQGRIEGNIEKLRAEREKTPEKDSPMAPCTESSPPMPPAPYVLKRKRRLVDESEDDLVRKLEFDERDVEEGVAERTRSRRNEDVVAVNQVKAKSEKMKKKKKSLKKVESVKRTSPRLLKRRSP
ncbi:hypothetical protein KY290_031963 [Solanum tuberosum]|uniref:Uncharacterized protein n=1 Tax=Solanum tuberosum TaxID=4113 RepID=A0ABQ7UAS3_SOLTU|nr:hypothetical protein KY290_031963 [Solanum tuberosum]